ncbi:MAG: MazG nucleotide pyrophosphohydrolase domain-containing protein [Eggerthella lenta]
MTASEPTPPIASPSPAAPLASQLAANPCSHPSFDQFVATIAALRAPDGCPWDRTQTHQSIAHNMIEEAYEAVDAIEAADVAHLREELGDVLLQVVLQSQIASDAGEFDINDVCADVNEKMVAAILTCSARRKPPTGDVGSVGTGEDGGEGRRRRGGRRCGRAARRPAGRRAHQLPRAHAGAEDISQGRGRRVRVGLA